MTLATKQPRTLPEPSTAGQILTLEDGGESFAWSRREHVNVERFGAISYPANTAFASMVDSSSAIQAAIDEAVSRDEMVFGSGRFRVDNCPTIKGHCDFRSAEFVTRTVPIGPALRAGQTGGVNTRNKVMWLPSVVQANKPSAPGWNASDIGVECISLYECIVFVGLIQNFNTGLYITSDGAKGNAYNDYHVRSLYNNKRNLVLDPQGAGAWVNQDRFFLSRMHHDTGEGANVSGARHILIGYGDGGSSSVVNNCSFFGGSVEGNTPEYHLECYGVDNYFYNLRWEATTPKVFFNQYDASNYATGNEIFGGYGANGIAFTESANAMLNGYHSRNQEWISGSGGADGVMILENVSGNASPAVTILPAGSGLSADPAAVYLSAFSGNLWQGKQTADANPRVQIDTQNARIEAGPGDTAVDTRLARTSVDAWVARGALWSQGVVTKVTGTDSTPYTAALKDETICVNATSGVFQVIMPSVSGAIGKRITVIKTDSSGNAVTVSRSNTSLINGSINQTLSAQYAKITVQTDGTNWFIV